MTWDFKASVTLADVYKTANHAEILYAMLKERPLDTGISHRMIPKWKQHLEFVGARIYRLWYFIISAQTGQRVGNIYLTNGNEIGVFILPAHQRRGYGKAAVANVIVRHKPLRAIPGVRPPWFLANISPKNEPSIKLFESMGFVHVQNTYKWSPRA